MFDTGVRVSELIRMTCRYLPDASDYPEGFNYYPLRVPGSKPYDGGNYKMRDTIISRPALARIQRYHSTAEYRLAKGWNMFDPNKPIFLNVHGEPLSKQSFYDGVKAAWSRQGENPDEIYPHRLRHGTGYSVLKSEFGKELLDNLLILKGMLGHESIKTTEIYSSIPIVIVQSLSNRQEVKFRYEEADEIYRATYLPGYKNIQKRGRRKC
jgi:integrase/recombinase XerC